MLKQIYYDIKELKSLLVKENERASVRDEFDGARRRTKAKRNAKELVPQRADLFFSRGFYFSHEFYASLYDPKPKMILDDHDDERRELGFALTHTPTRVCIHSMT